MTQEQPAGAVQVEAVGRLLTLDRQPGFVLVDPAGEEVRSATEWLLRLVADDSSPKTVRAYGMSLLRFLRFLWAVDCPWDRATEVQARDFVLWARETKKLPGMKREAGPRSRINLVTGKRYAGSSYSASTINHTLTAVAEFYRFQLEHGLGPVRNPIPEPRGGRPHAHHAPDAEFVRYRRGPLRQKEVQRTPRAIPDEAFDALFLKMNNNRDRALLAFYISSGARANELLGLTGDRVNYGDQLIGVIRKGGQLQWLPAAPDAFVWLRLYQLERGVARHDQRVWLTRREPFDPLNYDAFRAVIGRANRLLGTNWSTHDLRHTFSIRALDGGLPLHELQNLLGHASLESTTVYTTPRPDEVIEHHRAIFGPKVAEAAPAAPSTIYDADELSILFNRGKP